jgi:hypothetical protein
MKKNSDIECTYLYLVGEVPGSFSTIAKMSV